MKTINVIFSKAKAWYKIGSKVIAETEKRDYSHVALLFEFDNQKFIIQASGHYVNMVTYDNFLRDNVVIYKVPIILYNIQYSNLLYFCMNKLGTYYSKLQLLLLSVKKLFGLEINYNNGDKAMICSEFVIRALESGMKLNVKKKRDYITPSDVETILKENGLWT